MMMDDDYALDVEISMIRQLRKRARHAVPLRWLGVGMGTGNYRRRQAGLTLIELIVAMVVISVALVGVMSVINYTTRNSADPVVRHQAIAIAEAYMEEINLKNYSDPGGPPESGRADFDDVMDYDGLSDNGARNQNDDPIEDLENYDVSVRVTEESFGPAVETVNGLRIEVTVTDPANESLTLTGYRADY